MSTKAVIDSFLRLHNGLSNMDGDVCSRKLIIPQVNPLIDRQGTTALAAANLLFEMLCILPGVKHSQ